MRKQKSSFKGKKSSVASKPRSSKTTKVAIKPKKLKSKKVSIVRFESTKQYAEQAVMNDLIRDMQKNLHNQVKILMEVLRKDHPNSLGGR